MKGEYGAKKDITEITVSIAERSCCLDGPPVLVDCELVEAPAVFSSSANTFAVAFNKTYTGVSLLFSKRNRECLETYTHNRINEWEVAHVSLS